MVTGSAPCTFTSPVSSSYCQTNGPNGGPSYTTTRGRTTGSNPYDYQGPNNTFSNISTSGRTAVPGRSTSRPPSCHRERPSCRSRRLPRTPPRTATLQPGLNGRRPGVGFPADRGHGLERAGHHVHRSGVDFASQRVHGPHQLGRRHLERRNAHGGIGLVRREREPHLRRRGDRQPDRDGHRPPLAAVHRQQRRLRHLGSPGPSSSPTRH